VRGEHRGIGLQWILYKIAKGVIRIPDKGLCIMVGKLGVKVCHKNVTQLIMIRG
jgi:hypothetical protein